MKKIIIFLLFVMFLITFFSCSVNYKLNKSCDIVASIISKNGGKVSVCVVCDSITPKLFKSLIKKYGSSAALTNTHYERLHLNKNFTK